MEPWQRHHERISKRYKDHPPVSGVKLYSIIYKYIRRKTYNYSHVSPVELCFHLEKQQVAFTACQVMLVCDLMVGRGFLVPVWGVSNGGTPAVHYYKTGSLPKKVASGAEAVPQWRFSESPASRRQFVSHMHSPRFRLEIFGCPGGEYETGEFEWFDHERESYVREDGYVVMRNNPVLLPEAPRDNLLLRKLRQEAKGAFAEYDMAKATAAAPVCRSSLF